MKEYVSKRKRVIERVGIMKKRESKARKTGRVEFACKVKEKR